MAVIGLLTNEWILAQGVRQIVASALMINVVVFSKIFYLFNIRTIDFALSKSFFTNPKAFGIIGVMIILQILLTYLPFMQTVFNTGSLSWEAWVITILSSSSILIITEIDKYFRFKRARQYKAA